jgi:hypothetical protein
VTGRALASRMVMGSPRLHNRGLLPLRDRAAFQRMCHVGRSRKAGAVARWWAANSGFIA